ncbi:MAG: hypothetical protein KF720_15705 [Rubrivivax sp.]|nr:hypothetical protein [Rubrivivax sp.]
MRPSPSPVTPVWRRCAGPWLLLALVLLLPACASRAPRPVAAAEASLSELRARQIVSAWQQQLADYIEHAGGGDPAVLARLPAQRATGTLRPARITFGALDIDASSAERDGFDVQGLLLGTLPGADAGAEPYVFVVGIVQRDGYRPVALVDIRLVVLAAQRGQLDWSIGDGNPQALMRYRARLDPTVPLRFPADQDRFERVACAAGICAQEQLTSARWTLNDPTQ